MKTKKQVQAEIKWGDVFTLAEFCQGIETGLFSRYNGSGDFHDGENKTEMSVWDDSLTWNDVRKMPYVIWYNK